MSVAPALPEVHHSHRAELDAAVAEVRAQRRAWVRTGIPERIALLDEMMAGVAAVAERWSAECLAAEGLSPDEPASAEEPLVGPYLTLRALRLLRRSLSETERHGAPRPAGGVRALPDGRASARVGPTDLYDRLMYQGMTVDVWQQPGVTPENLAETQAVAYRSPDGGGVCVVLGGGNVSSIAPLDAVYKLFAENRVVVLKTHPTLAFLGPILEQAFAPLLRRGVLRIVHGGAIEGAHLVHHPGVNQVHITGSDRTYEAIMFGSGADGRERLARDEPVFAKPFSAELGCVTPVIITPARWSSAELDYHADNVATMLTNNASFNCVAARVIVTAADWDQRGAFLDRVRAHLAATPTRLAYYPGAVERYDAFVGGHAAAEEFGARTDGRLPWAFIPGLDPADRDEPCFSTESFCSVFGETALPASSAADFLDRAVAFVNERVWGTLDATLIVHPSVARSRDGAAAVERAVADLRYGTVGINHWSGVGYALAVTPWGAFPGHHRTDIQSGIGVVHNTLLFSRSEKSVIRAPFRARPKPVWFASHRRARRVADRMVRFESAPSLAKVLGMLPDAFRG
jgi:acyl-CoA reductase-like NAD-dependent aldehyde dehydrogenase